MDDMEQARQDALPRLIHAHARTQPASSCTIAAPKKLSAMLMFVVKSPQIFPAPLGPWRNYLSKYFGQECLPYNRAL
ncbi:hypothetical protein ACFPOU_14610 [Massilia jejuensis]|uniref:Uncharacterized protein n=1 Tax=Massilia jejuensis TaxID=648894 RepID=A0ABW0PI55_9BURK